MMHLEIRKKHGRYLNVKFEKLGTYGDSANLLPEPTDAKQKGKSRRTKKRKTKFVATETDALRM